jgi:hypothetical protein
MPGFDGTLARQLDFREIPYGPVEGTRRSDLRLATRPRLLRGPDKYKVLDQRRRQAQIRARRLLNLLD